VSSRTEPVLSTVMFPRIPSAGLRRRRIVGVVVVLCVVVGGVLVWRATRPKFYIYPRSAYDNSVFIVPPGSVLDSDEIIEPESGRYIDTGSAGSPQYLRVTYKLAREYPVDELLRWLLDNNPPKGWTFTGQTMELDFTTRKYPGGFQIGRSSLVADRWENVSISASGPRSLFPDRIATRIYFLYYLGPCKILKPSCGPVPAVVWDQSDPGPMGGGWPPIPSTIFR
jgi:hypothetical protein